jgi:hypothetical protein
MFAEAVDESATGSVYFFLGFVTQRFARLASALEVSRGRTAGHRSFAHPLRLDC